MRAPLQLFQNADDGLLTSICEVPHYNYERLP
jgi:hypothetical protein